MNDPGANVAEDAAETDAEEAQESNEEADVDSNENSEEGCGIRIRYSWRKLKKDNPEELKRYTTAVKKLYHSGKYMELAETHFKARNYAHGSNIFLPWHRAFLLKYEDMLREACPECGCVTVPYWDWIGDNGGMAEEIFCDDEDLCAGSIDGDITDGPFAGFELHGKPVYRNRHIGGLDVATQAQVNQFIAMKNYGTPGWDGAPAFASNIEGLHGYPHCAVGNCGGDGGTMGSHYSPADPIFYSHHAFVDYIWAQWQDCHDHDLIGKDELNSYEVAFRPSWAYKYDTENEDVMIEHNSKIAPWDEYEVCDMHSLTDIGVTYAPSHRQEAAATPFPTSIQCNFNWFPHLKRTTGERRDESVGEETDLIEVAAKRAEAKRAYAAVNARGHAKMLEEENTYEHILARTGSVSIAEGAILERECSTDFNLPRLPEEWFKRNNFHCEIFRSGCPSPCESLGYPNKHQIEEQKDADPDATGYAYGKGEGNNSEYRFKSSLSP